MPPLSVLLLGNIHRVEFAGIRESLAQWGTLSAIEDPQTAVDALGSEGLQPDWIVVAQTYPGEISREIVEKCRRRAPLARIIAVLGSWCEGETRTGAPWPATARTYWHQWQPRVIREFTAAQQGRLSAWSLPVTASDEERVLAEVEPASPPGGGLVVIHSASREMADWLSAALQGQGYASLWQPGFGQGDHGRFHVIGTTAVVYDATDFSRAEEEAVRQGRSRYPGIPLIVLMSFPRPEDRRRVMAAGGVLLSKPVSLQSLIGARV